MWVDPLILGDVEPQKKKRCKRCGSERIRVLGWINPEKTDDWEPDQRCRCFCEPCDLMAEWDETDA